MEKSNKPHELNDLGDSNKAFDSDGPSPHLTTNVVDEAFLTDASGKVTGTDTDAMEMMRMGRTQELRRNFKALSVLGLATTTMSTWVAMLMTSTFSLINGGLGGTIFIYLATWLCTFTLAASLAEMASMAPTSGGQYAWVSEFAPRSQQQFFSYVVGWLSALGWQALIATTAYTTSSLLLQLVALNSDSYMPTAWHETLLMIAVGVLATLFNTFGASKLPLLEGVVLVVHIFGWFAILVPLWVLAPKAPSSEVMTFSNFGGWSSIGTACFVGTITSTGSFAGSDAAAHLAEEVKDASRAVPRMIMLTVALNGVMALIFIITYCFCITDLEGLLASESAFGFVDIFLAGTNSRAGTTAMACIPLVLSACTCLNSLAAASRQAWALSRDNGLPFSNWFRKVTTIGTPIPLNAILLSLTILIILALINIGSSTAFNSIIGLMTSATSFSYALSIFCILLKRLRHEPLPPARFSLGKFAIPVNFFAVTYITVAAIASFFPLSTPTTAQQMNWSVVMFGGVFGVATVYYGVWGRHAYTPPVRHIHQAGAGVRTSAAPNVSLATVHFDYERRERFDVL